MTHQPDNGRLLALLEPVRVLDAFSCIDGATARHRRGFGNCQITGVDIQAQPDLRGWTAVQPAHPKHRGYVRGWRYGEYREGPYVAAYSEGGGNATVNEIRAGKGMDWSTDHLRLREALPSACTEWVGRPFLAGTGTLEAAA